MANQKITSLNELFAITASLDDLTVVVDVDDFSSPTGETKKMTLGELSKFALSTATLVSGSSQIFFSGLGDVSGSISGSPNYFIKVNANGTGVTYHESVETVEETIFQESSSFQVGQTVRRISGSYVTGSYNSETEASVVGVVRRVLSGSLSGSQIFTIVYSGRINFSQNPVDHTSGLNDGQVYYVGETGSLHDVNPNTCDHNLVGRPVLVSTGISGGFSTGIVFNSSANSGNEETQVQTFYQVAHGFTIGDAVRKTTTSGVWAFATADTAVNSEALGIVDSCPDSDHFSIVTHGLITSLSGLMEGSVYFLATSSLGSAPFRNIGLTEPLTLISKPMYVAVSTSSAIVVNYRGSEALSGGGGGGGGTGVSEDITQVAHGFSLGDVIRRTSGSWVISTADNDINAESLGVISVVADANNFTVIFDGLIDTLSGLMDGQVYFLATSSTGPVPLRNVTLTEPLTPYVSKPIYVATSPSSAIITSYRGVIIASGSTELSGSALFISGSHTSRFIGNVEITGSLVITSSATFKNIGMTILEGPTTASIISASFFIGDGSGLTGVSTGSSPGTISSSLQFTNTDDVTFRNITASNITASALFVSGSETSRFVGNVEVTGSLTVTSSATFRNIGMTILEGPTTASIISASVFIGDGSGLTGVVGSSPGTISSSLQFGLTDDVTFRNITASIVSASIFIGDGSNVTGIISSSYSISSSHSDVSDTSSFVTLAQTASFVLSSSYAVSASHANLSDTASLANSVAYASITGKPTLVSSSLQFTNTDDVTFRNVTASIISSSYFIGDISLTTTSTQSISVVDIDWSVGAVFVKSITSSVAFTFSNIQPKTIVISITNSGSYTSSASWPSIHWPSGSEPVLSTSTSSITDIFTFISLGSVASSVYGVADQHFP